MNALRPSGASAVVPARKPDHQGASGARPHGFTRQHVMQLPPFMRLSPEKEASRLRVWHWRTCMKCVVRHLILIAFQAFSSRRQPGDSDGWLTQKFSVDC